MNTAQEVAKMLLEKKAVKISVDPPFTWTSGIKSPIYCDNRVLISYPDAREVVMKGFKEVIKEQNLNFDVIGGTATAAIPWAAFLAHELKMPMVYIRPKAKEHGAGKQVEGNMEKGSKVLIIEDLFSTGGSSILSAQACEREFDAKIAGAIAIFSYQMQKAIKGFETANIPAFSISDFPTLVQELEISNEQKALITQFKDDPESWWEKFKK